MWLSPLVELSPNKSTKARDETELIYTEPRVTWIFPQSRDKQFHSSLNYWNISLERKQSTNHALNCKNNYLRKKFLKGVVLVILAIQNAQSNVTASWWMKVIWKGHEINIKKLSLWKWYYSHYDCYCLFCQKHC